MMVQPFVKNAVVTIDPDVVKKRQGVYKYITLTGEMLHVSVTIKYGKEQITAKLSYVPEMDYPLMYLDGGE
jgi:hypothetical protein